MTSTLLKNYGYARTYIHDQFMNFAVLSEMCYYILAFLGVYTLQVSLALKIELFFLFLLAFCSKYAFPGNSRDPGIGFLKIPFPGIEKKSGKCEALATTYYQIHALLC